MASVRFSVQYIHLHTTIYAPDKRLVKTKTTARKQSFIHISFVCAPEDIVNGNIVKICELYEDLGRNVYVASFVVAVNTLAAIEYLSDLDLSHISFLTQVPDPFVHNDLLWHFTQIIICIFVKIIIYYFVKST